ncbi:hypothetical protein H632_c391p2 [Helicosporidium sp. ATCC 50920]|nr:hypothetical protein H632_c391p2 [Helicosporidium sp. ATCC 50920]|eukprot:KDD76025.1 hypothetical protein H632_c391p2 [Helicosporidium sp. ATCC 50920]
MSELYDQEILLENTFKSLSEGFRKLDRVTDANKRQALLKQLTSQMQEAKTLIRDFEQEAAADGMDPVALASRKKALVQELNGYIGLRKSQSAANAEREEMLAGARTEAEMISGMGNEQLMSMGRSQINETDASLLRSERIVHDTIAVGAQTAETLQAQGEQLEKIMDDLDEIEFTMKKAQQVMKDMVRGITTDKCLMVLLLLVVCAIIAVIVVRVLKSKGKIGGGDSPSSDGSQLLVSLLSLLGASALAYVPCL